MQDDKGTTLEATERGVAWTDAAGKRYEYSREVIRTFSLEMQELKAGFYLDRVLLNKEPVYSPLKPRMYGKAHLEDRSVQVIGRPETATNEVYVSIWELTEEDRAREANKEEANEESEPARRFKQAGLFYFDGDWEIGTDANWSLNIHLPSSQFQTLYQVYESKRLTKLAIGIRFHEGAYVTEWYAPPSVSIDWFIEPGKYSPEPAFGNLDSLTIEKKAIDLRPPAVVLEVTDDSQPETELPSSSDEATAQVLRGIYEKLDGIYKHLGWIFWAIVAVAVLGKWR